MLLSKSNYCKALGCKKSIWLSKHKQEEKDISSNQSVLDNGTLIGLTARELFTPYKEIEYNQDLSKMVNQTKEYLKTENITLCEASFLYNDNFCSVDILKKEGNCYYIYEVKSSTEITDIYKEDLAYQYYILTRLGLNVIQANLVYINSKYE